MAPAMDTAGLEDSHHHRKVSWMALPSAPSPFFIIPIWRDWKLLLPSLGAQTVLPTENSKAEPEQSGNKRLQSSLNVESRTALGAEVLLFLSVPPTVLKPPPPLSGS